MDWLLQLDGDILLWIQTHLRREWLDPVVTFITGLGDGGWFWLVLLAVMLIFKKSRGVGQAGLIAVLIGFIVTNLILKNAVARIRPYEAVEGLNLIGRRARDFSFPSGHSTCSMAASTVLLLKLPKQYGVPALCLGIGICLSRLYIGIHYPSDVLAGMAIGIGAAVVASQIKLKV